MSISSWFSAGGYTPSGKCDWLKLLTIALPLSVPAACLFACALYLCLYCHFYLLILMPALAGALLGLAISYLFQYAHCRNPHVAFFLAAIAASVMYLGYYHCRFVGLAGPRALVHIEVLPKFINFCLHHDIARSTHDVGNQAKQPSFYENVFFFIMDWGFAAASCGAVAFVRARQAYCETHARWMIRKKAKIAAGNAAAVIRHISAKKIAALPVFSAAATRLGPAAQFELEYCPGNPDQADVCPIFLTAKEVVPGNNKTVTVARQMPLSVEDLAALSQKLSFR